MYRINSITKQVVSIQVIQDGEYKAVSLLPGNFVFSEKTTAQLLNLQNQRCIRIQEVSVQAALSKVTEIAAAPSKVTSTASATKKATTVSTVEATTADKSAN